MRPHLLELNAFGAFPREVSLDFDELGASGLVLLCGETGGGKSTLLDALGFALFGRVPGIRGRASMPDLRSHHADPAAEPWVRLTFSIDGARYRVERTPAYERPKKRAGGGTVRVHPSALLQRADGAAGWEPLASRNEDVGHEIGLLLGMSSDQFFQVVMLPQGRFADFLHADHDNREALLKRLFGVARFEFAEQWLSDRAKEAAEGLDVARSELGRIAAQVAQAGDVEAPADPDVEVDAAWAATVAGQSRRQAEECAARAVEAAAARSVAESSLAQAEQYAERQQERRDLTRRLAALHGRGAEIELTELRLDAARRAGGVSTAIGAVTVRRNALQRADAVLTDALQLLARLGADNLVADSQAADSQAEASQADASPSPRPDAELLAASGRRRRAEAGELAGLAALLSSAESAEAAALTADQDAATHGAVVDDLERRLGTELPARRVELAAAVERARAATARLGPLRERQQLATDLAKAVRKLTTAEQAADDDAVASKAARAQAVDLRRQRFEAITAELAAGLESDTPCPVCGSLNHPDPTEARADHVSKDDELAAEATADRLAVAYAKANGRCEQLRGQLVELRARFAATAETTTAETTTAETTTAETATTETEPRDKQAGRDERPGGDESATTDPAVFRAAATALAAVVTKLEPLASGLGRTEAALADVVSAEADARAELAKHQALRQAAVAKAADARTRAAESRRHLPADVGDLATLTARRQALEALAEAYDAARDAAVATARAAEEALAAAEIAQAQAVRAGFTGPDQAAEALRDDGWAAAASDLLQTYRDQLVAVQARLASEELAVDVDADPGLDARAAEALAARDHHDRAARALGVAEDRARQLAGLVEQFVVAVTAIGPLRDAAAERRGLSDLTAGRGANRENMPLSSFVLAARLEQVASAASARLSAMTTGRFTMLLDDSGPRDRRRRAGLGLLVEDAWTGRRRATATLSGGETFQAALSLALGLADVVTAESGGRSMDALFIDEGFGTLDPDSLEEVMDVLDELRTGGRLVGVVSHVAELRQRIPSQVQVAKDTSGSTIRTTGRVGEGVS